MRGDALAATGETEGLGRGRLDADRVDRDAEVCGQHGSHRFLRMAQAQGMGQAAVEKVFSAYFFEGRDIGRRETLLEIASEIGLDAEA